MPAASSGLFKPLTWLLLLALIGVIALYDWYTASLKQQLAGRDEAVEQTELQLLQTGKKLDSAAQEGARLKQEMDDLTAQYQGEAKALSGKLDAAKEFNAALRDQMEQLEQSHAATLAAEQQQAADAYAALLADKEGGDQRITELEGAVEQLNQTLADNVENYKADLAAAVAAFEDSKSQWEEEFAERVASYRIALEGSQPELAAKLSAMEERIETSRKALGEAELAIKTLEADKTQLTQQLASVTQERDAKEAARAQTANDIAVLEDQLKRSKAESAEAAALLEKTRSEAEAELEATQQAAAAALQLAEADAAAAMQQAQAQHAAQIEELEGRIVQLGQELEAERAALATLQQQFDTQATKLSETAQTLAGVEAELKTTQEQALQNQTTLEGELADAQARIADTEQALASTREQAANEKAALQQESRDAVAHVRGLFSDMSALGGRRTEAGMLFNLGKEQLRFRISSAKLPKREFPILDQLAGLLNKYPQLTARIEGHTDNTGREATNLTLSQQRAETVMQELVNRGVAASRMEAVGVGPIRPIADNNTDYGRALNRRVEVYVNES